MATRRKSSRTAKSRTRRTGHSADSASHAFGGNGTTRRAVRRGSKGKTARRRTRTVVRQNKPFAVKVNGKKTAVASAWFFGG
ncbi:MAG TPA: hypothetical protein VGB22_06940 [candidate division Zixibacteria bacterium]|jgi:hypothetical protein